MGDIQCVGCDQQPGRITMSGQKIQVPDSLSARDKSSFAYKTIKDRLPVIIVKVIDFLHRQRKELHKFGTTIEKPNETELAEIEADAKSIIAQLTKVRKELETNKPVELIERLSLPSELEYFNDDVELWNKSLEANKTDDGTLPRWFDSPWLLVECYLYRKIKEACLRTKHMQLFDLFAEPKQAACRSSKAQMLIVANHLIQTKRKITESANQTHPSERKEFSLFVQLSLWANKSDLSISNGSVDQAQAQKLIANIRESLEELQENILCDNMSEIWFKVQSIKSQVKGATATSKELIYIDLVADNSGYEIFADLCLLHFLALMLCPISLQCSGVRFRIHLKRMPWFVSDTLRHDILWLIKMMSTSENEALKELAEDWSSFLESNFWELHDDKFWTMGDDYSTMETLANDLYRSLQQSSLIIFKGDLNYRKLVGDRKWHILTPFEAALRGFAPAPLAALRTAKADVVVGIEDINIFSRINNNELPRDWMITGDFGLIQFLDPL